MGCQHGQTPYRGQAPWGLVMNRDPLPQTWPPSYPGKGTKAGGSAAWTGLNAAVSFKLRVWHGCFAEHSRTGTFTLRALPH